MHVSKVVSVKMFMKNKTYILLICIMLAKMVSVKLFMKNKTYISLIYIMLVIHHPQEHREYRDVL